MSDSDTPKLRLIDAQPIEYEGATYLYLRDPLELTEKNLLVPQPMVPLLALCDGTRNRAALRGALALRYGVFLSPDRIDEMIEALDDALLLDNERTAQARLDAQKQFRAAPFRTPASAGHAYPKEREELRAYLQGYYDSLNGGVQPVGSVRGIISPHIDYDRGGPVYAQVWGASAEAVREADLAIIFGTDHFSEGYPISLTRQNYATPFGVLPTDVEIVDKLAEAVGPIAYAGELHHRREHSIELAAVWLHHLRDEAPIALVPVLTGSLGSNGSGLETSVDWDRVLNVLREATAGRNVIVIAAGDLAHVGPAFGGEPVDPGKLMLLKGADDELIRAMCAGDAEGFYRAIERVQDANNVCGVSPIYLTLRMLAPLAGQSHGYAVCPADQQNTSVVTICGVTLQ